MEIQKIQQQSLDKIQSLQDAVMMLSDQPHLHAYGERRINPLNTFENRYTYTTIRTVLEDAQRVGSALVYLQQETKVADEDFKVGIIASNTQQEAVLNLACIMYNITQVYIENELDNTELSQCLDKVDFNILFGAADELEKILKFEKLKPIQVFTFDKKQDEEYESFEALKDIGQQNRSAWKDAKDDATYGIFFNIKKQFEIVKKTHQQLLHDIVSTQQKLEIEQTKKSQGTYISLNGSGNYYEHVFRLYNLLYLHNRIALPSQYQNYLTDLYLAQPTIIMANFHANYAKIQKDQQNSEVNFQKYRKNLLDQKDGFVKTMLKSLFYQAPLQQVKYNQVQYVLSINEAEHHHVRDLLEESIDVSVATFQKAINFLEHDGVYTAKDVEFKDCEGLNMSAKNKEGYIVLKNSTKPINTIYLGRIVKDNVFLNGFTSDYIKMKKDKVINAREMESFYRNNNPQIQDMFLSYDEKQDRLVGVVDMHNIVQELELRKDQSGNEYLKKNLLNLLEEYRAKTKFGEEAKVSKVHIEQNGFRNKNLLDKYGVKKQERFEAFYKQDIEGLKSDKQQLYQFINSLFNEEKLE